VRAGATLWSVLDMLTEHPIVSAGLVAERFGIASETARQLLHRLETLGVVAPSSVRVSTPGRPAQWWVAPELIEVISRWA
jgi:predicted ArsR family transcriptional regulator